MKEVKRLVTNYLIENTFNKKKSDEIKEEILKLCKILNSLSEQRKIWYLKLFGSEKITYDLQQAEVYMKAVKNLLSEEVLSKNSAKNILELMNSMSKVVENVEDIIYKARDNLAKELKKLRKNSKDLKRMV